MTGLTCDQVDDLVARMTAHGLWPLRRRRALAPRQAVIAVLLYLRHNLSQPLLAELFGCSQPTISRLITQLMPVLSDVLDPIVKARTDRELRSTVRIDGFLAPIGDRREGTYTSGMYSGKRHRCGFNIQVVASGDGRLVMTGRPQPGAMHDARAWRESGLAALFTARMHTDGGPGGFADTAYTGTGLMRPQTPHRTRTAQHQHPRIQQSHRIPTRLRRTRHRPPQRTGRSSPPATAAYWTTSRQPSPQSPHWRSTGHRRASHE